MWDIFHKIFIEIGMAFVSLCHIRTLLKEDWEYIRPITEFVERRIKQRRKNMGIANWIQDVEALIALEPLLFKFIADARAAAPQLESDGAELVDKLKAIFHPAPVPPTAA